MTTESPTLTPRPQPAVTPSAVRVLVPLVVGIVVTQFARIGLSIDNATATAIVTPAVAWLYYVVARVLETHVSTSWGRLLGMAAQPHYIDAASRVVGTRKV